MKLLIVLFALSALGACSKSAQQEPQGVIPENQKQALENARAVEDQIKNATEQRMQDADKN